MKLFKKLFIVIFAIVTVFTLAGCEFNLHFSIDVGGNEENDFGNHIIPDDVTTKKGVSVSRYNDGSEESVERINSLNVSWYYNWGNRPSGDIEAEYVPMVWGGWKGTNSALERIKEGYEAGTFKYLLTFNEPDYTSQSNLTVERAIELWPQLEEIGIPLSSPAPAYYSSGWLDKFMSEANKRGYRVDFIALHCYQDFSDPNAPEKLRTELLEIYEKYRLPIWITEFGAIDITVWGGGKGKPECTKEAALTYTQNVTDMLESLGFVERYAWFIDNVQEHGSARAFEAEYTTLFNDDDTISATGEVYRDRFSGIPLSIELPTVFMGKIGEEYTLALLAVGGTGDVTFSLAPPDGFKTKTGLPEGLEISEDGIISGTPTKKGTCTVLVRVTDEMGQFTYRTFNLTIQPE